MNRRSFLSLFGAGVAGIALEQAIPFNRVWSFPKEIVVAPFDFGPNYLRAMQYLTEHVQFANHFNAEWDKNFLREFAVGQTISVRVPQRFIVQDVPTRKEMAVFKREAFIDIAKCFG